jgi:putative FmdB family regulatory protein
MPVYDYKCKTCNGTTSVQKGIGESEVVPICFKCRGAMQRDYSFGSVQFKGGGFYSNDR